MQTMWVPLSQLILRDANQFALVTFLWWIHLQVGIPRRWSCTVSLRYFMDITHFKDIMEDINSISLWSIIYKVLKHKYIGIYLE